MKKSLLITMLMCVIPAAAQNWTTVTATNITDLNQQKLAAGQLCFMATDQNDNPISTGVGGGGQLLRRQYCSQVTAGGLPASFTVPNPANTQPAGVYYRVTVKDSSTGQEVLRYTQVSFTGASFNFDTYAPINLGTPAPLSGNAVTGNLSVSGNVSATGTVTASNIPASILQQVFDSGTGLTQRTALNCMAGIKCADNAGTARTDVRLGTLATVAFSATPIFDASTASTFKLTLTGNVTSSTLTNAVAGEPLAFEICQDATGGRTFVPPANVQGWLPIASAASACSLEVFYYDGTNAQPDLLAGLAGDVTSSPGSTATTVGKIQGTTVSGTTGTGAAVLGTSPTITTPSLASPTITAKGDFTETTAPSGVVGADRCYGDSTAHALECSYNNGTFGVVPLLNRTGTWTATQTFSGPVINGTPTGTGIPTLTLKQGTGAGNYTTASTTYVVVDSTNLCYTVTIPTGWKLAVTAAIDVFVNTGAVNINFAVTDNGSCSTVNAGILQQSGQTPATVGSGNPMVLAWVINGDGASHNIALQYRTSNASDAVGIVNGASGFVPSMVFILSPSN